MALEIERKFLVSGDEYRKLAKPTFYRQGYIPTKNGATVRVRVAGEKAFITIKDKQVGFSRNEYEYEIPRVDADKMLETLCEKPQSEKFRYVIPWDNGLKWEVDEFLGDNEGLVFAEIEVPNENTEFNLPSWVSDEATFDK